MLPIYKSSILVKTIEIIHEILKFKKLVYSFENENESNDSSGSSIGWILDDQV